MEKAENSLIVEKRPDHIAIVTINRPEARNAVNGDVTRALAAAVRTIEQDDEIWLAIIAGSGGSVFCAGADLKEVSRGNLAALMDEDAGFAGFVHASRRKPWIAAVEGLALAGGCEIALACDMVVASEGGAFGLPEVSRGLIASAGGIYRLPRAIPRAIAIEVMLTAGRLTSERAAELGMVNRIAPKGHALEVALELAKAVTANAPLAVRETLAIAKLSADRDDSELRDLSDAGQARVMQSADFAEGPLAFIEKRAPVWTGT